MKTDKTAMRHKQKATDNIHNETTVFRVILLAVVVFIIIIIIIIIIIVIIFYSELILCVIEDKTKGQWWNIIIFFSPVVTTVIPKVKEDTDLIYENVSKNLVFSNLNQSITMNSWRFYLPGFLEKWLTSD